MTAGEEANKATFSKKRNYSCNVIYVYPIAKLFVMQETDFLEERYFVIVKVKIRVGKANRARTCTHTCSYIF